MVIRMSGEAWLSGAWLGAQLPRTHPAKTSISLGIANLTTIHVFKYGVRSPKFIWTPVYSCTHWLRVGGPASQGGAAPPPPAPYLGS
jgi:hypothetical protein